MTNDARAAQPSRPQPLAVLAQNSAETLAVLRAHGLGWELFAGRPKNCYLHRLAQHSPAQLGEFLTLAFAPGMTAREKAPRCPPWPPGGIAAGKPPTHKLVWKITRRLNAARSADWLVAAAGPAKGPRAEAAELPPAPTDEVTDQLCNLLAREIYAEKVDQGRKVSELIKPLETLLRKQRLQLAGEVRDHMLKDDQARALELCLADAKRFPEVVEKFQAAFAALKQARTRT